MSHIAPTAPKLRLNNDVYSYVSEYPLPIDKPIKLYSSHKATYYKKLEFQVQIPISRIDH